MLELAVVMLAGGAKGFFENSAYLIGVPLVALGAIGMLVIALVRPPKEDT